MPAALIVDAVDAGDIAQVAAVFDQAVAAGEAQQLVDILAGVRLSNPTFLLAAAASTKACFGQHVLLSVNSCIS